MTPHAVLFWGCCCVVLLSAFAVGYLRGEQRAWKRHAAEEERRVVRLVSSAALHDALGSRYEQLRERAWWN